MEAVVEVMAVIKVMAVTEVMAKIMAEIMVVDQLFFDRFYLTSSI